MKSLGWSWILAVSALWLMTACEDDVAYRSGSNTDGDVDGEVCGDGDCRGGETSGNCPEDCTNVTDPDPGPSPTRCGDGICEGSEGAVFCPEDCGDDPPPPPDTCGNGLCEPDETPRDCPEDCADDPPPPPIECGDGICEGRESPRNCPEDCADDPPPPSTVCGNGICEPGEGPTFCRDDCPRIECIPYENEDNNACEIDGQRACVAITPEEGLCFPSGDIPIGEDCRMINASPFGTCTGEGLCVPEEGDDGFCRRMCQTWAPEGVETGCESTQVCALFGQGIIGYCTDNAFTPRIGPLEPCDVPGFWCDEASFCIQVDQQGNNVCTEVCRFEEGNGDCSEGTTCEDVLQSITLGLCLP